MNLDRFKHHLTIKNPDTFSRYDWGQRKWNGFSEAQFVLDVAKEYT
jgi:hypothetical protein